MRRSFVSPCIVFLALQFTLITHLPSHAANIYQIIYASPTNINSVARDLNDHGVLLGTVADTNTYFHFTSLDGAITQLQSPAGTNDFQVVALNNHGHIIGTYTVPTPTAAGGTYYYSRAFLQTPATNILLGESFTNENSVPLDLNDRGDVVGTIGNDAALLYPNTLRLPDPNMVLFGRGGNYGALHAINENRLAAGHFGGTAAFWPNLVPGGQEFLPERDDSVVLAINNHGHMVGRTTFRTSVDQPFLRTVTNISLLGSPRGYHAEPLSINDHGAIVGTAKSINGLPPFNRTFSSDAILWTNGVAINLTSLLPHWFAEHNQLIQAVAINEEGQIAATLRDRNRGSTRAVILQPTNTLQIPPLRIVGPSAPVLHTNSVIVSIEPYSPTSINGVSYTLYRRVLLPSTGAANMYQQPQWTVEPYRTNSFSVSQSLPAGQYTLFATVYLDNQIIAYPPPIFFTIAAPPAFTAAQHTFRNTFEFAVHGGSAYQHAIEASSDLTHWIPIYTNSLGGGFEAGPSTQPQLFYRARVTSTDPEHFGATISTPIPQHLVHRAFRLYSYENQFAYRLEFTDATQVHLQLEESGATNIASYIYKPDSDRSHLHIDLPEQGTRLEFQLQWSFQKFMPHDWRLTKITPTGKIYSEGRFFESGRLPGLGPVRITPISIP